MCTLLYAHALLYCIRHPEYRLTYQMFYTFLRVSTEGELGIYTTVEMVKKRNTPATLRSVRRSRRISSAHVSYMLISLGDLVWGRRVLRFYVGGLSLLRAGVHCRDQFTF